MISDDWVCRVVDRMSCLIGEFRTNELAYLALTSKVEKPIVDRLAYSLHRNHGDEEGVGIAREFTVPKEIRREDDDGIQRVDLAVTVNKRPHLLLEAKAASFVTIYSEAEKYKYPGLVCKDMKKLKKYSPINRHNKIARLALLLVTYADGTPGDELNGIVKSASRIRNTREKYCKDKGIADLEKKVGENFPKDRFPPVKFGAGEIDGGCAFGIGVKVHYRLFKPF